MKLLIVIAALAISSFVYEGTLAHIFREPNWSLAFDRAWFYGTGAFVAWFSGINEP